MYSKLKCRATASAAYHDDRTLVNIFELSHSSFLMRGATLDDRTSWTYATYVTTSAH